jgi:hypothetical protein
MIYLFRNNEINPSDFLDQIAQFSWYVIPLCVVLSLGSWMVESSKWKVLVLDFERIRFRESVTQNLTAQAASFITPLRAGEYGLKAMFFDSVRKKDIVTRVMAGNLNQLVVTVFFGLSGMYVYSVGEYHPIGVYLCSVAALLIGSVIYLILKRFWGLSKISFLLWCKVTCLSLLRFCLFASVWLLVLFQSEFQASWLELAAATSVFYLVVSVLPLIQLLDLPVRLTTASMIFYSLIPDANFIVAATFLIWLTNTILPTLIGCLLLPKKEFKALRTT